MADERFRQIERLYHGALERPAAERRRWLEATCGDDDMRREVEALLHYDTADTGFLESSALTVEAVAAALARRRGFVGWRIGGYDVLAFLGAGGMGEVYRARDVRLRREVALKLFERTSVEPLARFEAEARAASALTHPNIVTIYGIGEEGDTAFIAMELVQGRSLRDLLSGAPLPLTQVLDIAVQLADAMATAHAAGIVHRDLKPENVMMSPGGHVKVLDFGIATLLHEVSAGDGAHAAGAWPSIAGTVGYMAPEQERGQAASPATDQFAFGVICHEMLTGRRPFSGTSHDAPPGTAPSDADAVSLGALTAETAPLVAVVSRCLSKDPSGRYADSSDLLAEVRRARLVAERGDGRTRLGRRTVLSLAAMTALAVSGGIAAWLVWPGSPQRPSLAVLPFANPTQDEGTEYLSDGISEALIRQLGRLPAVRVIARATAFTFKGSGIAPAAIGRQLGVAAVLTGTVTRRAGRVLISAELVESATGARLWGDDYDKPPGDVLAVQHEIAAAILGDGLHVHLTDEERRRLTRMPTDDAAAYELFLQAVHHLRLATEEDYLDARDLLQRAVERAPGFALAWVTLASTYSVMAVDGYMPPGEAWPQSAMHVAQALAIDPSLPDAHAEAASSAFFYEWNRREAERRWTTALGLRSEVQSELLTAYALMKWAAGEPQAALELARAARQVDPLNVDAAVREGDVLAALGRLEDATRLYERIVRDSSGDARALFGLAEARRRQGRFDEALAARRRAYLAAGDAALEPLFVRARGPAGYDDVVRAAASDDLDRMRARREAGGYVSPLDFARAAAQLGDAARAFAYLAEALNERAAGLVLLEVDPAWDRVRGDPRFAKVVARVGIHM